jgi:hypothetical protein
MSWKEENFVANLFVKKLADFFGLKRRNCKNEKKKNKNKKNVIYDMSGDDQNELDCRSILNDMYTFLIRMETNW